MSYPVTPTSYRSKKFRLTFQAYYRSDNYIDAVQVIGEGDFLKDNYEPEIVMTSGIYNVVYEDDLSTTASFDMKTMMIMTTNRLNDTYAFTLEVNNTLLTAVDSFSIAEDTTRLYTLNIGSGWAGFTERQLCMFDFDAKGKDKNGKSV
eukprot:TRINITY_DN4892_c0_g3_i2.p1 TRINITY_DN4892_c0_g3~~TRINITY_DN4892_c0_g3_i2.p1  ORF type:complete len:148 (+),score=21.87 TRINITY_DN4892_c0_g3_i2:275-718(+)